MNICMCGAEDGYPHADDCPRPLFRGSEEDQRRWRREHQELSTQKEDPPIMQAAKMHLLLLARGYRAGTTADPRVHIRNLTPGDVALLLTLLHDIHQLDHEELAAIDFDPDLNMGASDTEG